MSQSDWSLGAWGLTLVAVAAVALLFLSAILISNALNEPLDRIAKQCKRRNAHIAATDLRAERVARCEERAQAALELPPG